MSAYSQPYELYDALPNPLFLYTAKGEFHYMNTAAADIIKSHKAVSILDFFSFFKADHKTVLTRHQKLKSNSQKDAKISYTALFDADASFLRYGSISTRIFSGEGNNVLFISQVALTDLSRETQLEKEVFREKYELILETTPAMIWITNRENRPIYSNRSMRDFLGADITKMESQKEFELLIHPDDVPIAITAFNTSIIKRQPVRNEFRILTAAGSYKWVIEEAAPQFDKNNTYLGYNGKLTDIDEIKRIQEDLQHTQHELGFLINEAGLFVCRHSLDGTIQDVSPSCREILGYQQEELRGASMEKLVHPDDFNRNFKSSAFTESINSHIRLVNRIKTKENVYKWIEMQGAFIRDHSGQATGIICMARDISSQLEAEQKLGLSKRFLENTRSMIAVTGKDRKIEWVNESFCDTTGFTREELIGKKASDLLHGPLTDKKTVQFMREKLDAGEVFECELVNYTKDRKPYWIFFRCEPIRNSAGEIEKYFAIEEDISHRKSQEESLRIAATFPELNPNPVLRINRKGDVLYRNPPAASMNEIFYKGSFYSLSDLCRMIASSDGKKLVLSPVEINRKYYEITCLEVEDSNFINIYCSDITELTNTALRLKNSERKYRTLAENSKDMICLHNAFDQFLYVSPSSKLLLEFEPDELAGQALSAICHPEDQLLLRKSFEKIIEGKNEMITLELRMRKKSGVYTWVELQLFPILEEAEIAGVQSSTRDISQQKFQELRLKVNELKYRRLIDNMDLGYMEVGKDGKVSYANESFCRMTKFSSYELVGGSPEVLLLPLDEQQEEMRIHNKNRQEGIAEVYQMQIKRKDGVIRTLLISGAPLVNEEGAIVGSAGIHWDITPLLEMEIRLHEKEVQRQRSILQASIRTEEKQKQTLGRELHDGLGQLLAYISLNMQLLLDKKCEAKEIVDKTKELINNAIAEVRQLSRTLIPVALDNTKSLLDIISESLVLYANMRGLRFEIEQYDTKIDQKLDVDQKHIIFRIVQELTNNTIKYADASVITLNVTATTRSVSVLYTDNGIGFNPKKIRKGVGFESIQTRIESYNGKLSINSSPGKGAQVSFTIPLINTKVLFN